MISFPGRSEYRKYDILYNFNSLSILNFKLSYLFNESYDIILFSKYGDLELRGCRFDTRFNFIKSHLELLDFPSGSPRIT